MSATHIQCGITNHRINREPLDAESVFNSYSDIVERTIQSGDGTTYKGTFYAGLYTSVVNDEDATYNGPYYISYEVDEETSNLCYVANKLSTSYEIYEVKKEIEEEVNTVLFGWGTLE